MKLRRAGATLLALMIGTGSATAQEVVTSAESTKREQLAATAKIWAGLESAYDAGRASGNLLPLKRELERLFSDENESRRRLGLNWIGRHLADLTYQQQEDLYRVYIELRPRDGSSERLLNTIAANRLAAAPREERATLYWAAVRQGQTRIPKGEPLDRVSAIRLAAVEGLDEFAPTVQRYASELNARFRHEGFLDSEYMELLLKLRAGAENGTDALRLQATRLAELGDSEFSDRIDSDAAFRQATFNVASLACEERQSDVACRELGKIYGRQLVFQKAHARREATEASAQSQSDARPEPAWMPQFRKWTEGAWTTMELEKQEQSRKAVR